MQSRNLSFGNNKFRIMQIADVQEVWPVSPDTIRLIEASLDVGRPDLVIFTGDQIKGYSSKCKGKNGAGNICKIIKEIIAPFEKRGIPFAVTFGNHDSQGAMSNADQMEIYKTSPFCVFSDYASEDDCGTYCLEVKNNEEVSALIYLMDTHSNAPEGGYDSVNEKQLGWYRRTRDRYSCLPSFAFQHIPAPEYFDVLNKVRRFTKGAVRAFGNHENEYFVLDSQNCREGDFMGESPAAPYRNRGQVDAFLEKGEMKALFVGHDHNNSFVADYKGLALAYTQGAGFNVYGPGLDRGVRIVDITPDGSWDTHTLTYSMMLGKSVNNKIKYYLYSYAPTSLGGVKAAVKETGMVLGALSLVAGGVYLKLKRGDKNGI